MEVIGVLHLAIKFRINKHIIIILLLRKLLGIWKNLKNGIQKKLLFKIHSLKEIQKELVVLFNNEEKITNKQKNSFNFFKFKFYF